jgi:glycosyltransferase involved in cell wall biosynthesis
MAKIYHQQLGVPTRYVYNGVALEDYPFNPNRGTRLLYVGRIAKIKQPHVALEVARQVGVPVEIIGGDRFVDDFGYVTAIRNACDGIHARYIGEVPHDVKLKHMQDTRAVLICSRMNEPFGLVAVEALACGRTVVCLNDGALSEIVTPSVGFVCQTPEEMIRILKEEKDLAIKPEHCRRRAEEFGGNEW